jgi:hypothetical protein
VILVLRGKQTIGLGVDGAGVVLIPHDDDNVVPFVPNGRRLNGLHNALESGAILLDQTRVQANLRAVGEPLLFAPKSNA